MGREARCTCRWGSRSGYVTALLESTELIVRGDICARTAIHSLEEISVRGDTLAFSVAGERIELAIGAVPARRWAAAIAAPPPTLARKLGITSTTRLHITGAIDDDALRTALANAAEVTLSITEAGLAIVRTDERATISAWAKDMASDDPIPPAWIVFVKGRGAPRGETGVRDVMRALGFIDTKVASVSERLSALRFVTKRHLR